MIIWWKSKIKVVGVFILCVYKSFVFFVMTMMIFSSMGMLMPLFLTFFSFRFRFSDNGESLFNEFFDLISLELSYNFLLQR